jgi:hypothetical protein
MQGLPKWVKFLKESLMEISTSKCLKTKTEREKDGFGFGF